ncbi:hypothetical protein [Erythrobacter sp.]|uniref:hypothetical protein n=1 Tax=Erythrobacter sp. TaxID=1042 RepID=UPI001B2D5475|nr:hypothetical protein [Erythrobacter sp.]MBO6527097.1 hypothetical protein [Erythrobacter sp.]MBO6528977.1 hypothetical protein [Erythrobacter sp.]
MIGRTSFDTPCHIAIEQSDEHFHAHVELEGDVAIYPGDSVHVHGAPIQIAFGERASFDRMATVTRAGPLTRAWTKIAAYFDFAELYEVSFNPGSLK